MVRSRELYTVHPLGAVVAKVISECTHELGLGRAVICQVVVVGEDR
jgi:hypothetical protein